MEEDPEKYPLSEWVGVTHWLASLGWESGEPELYETNRFEKWRDSIVGRDLVEVLCLWDWDSYLVKCISWYLMPLPWERMSSLSWFAWDFPVAVPDRSLPFQNSLSPSRAGPGSPVLDSGIQGWNKTLNGFFLLSLIQQTPWALAVLHVPT